MRMRVHEAWQHKFSFGAYDVFGSVCFCDVLGSANCYYSTVSDGYGAVVHGSQFPHLFACSRFLAAVGYS